MYLRLSLLFTAIFILGTFLTLLIFKFNLQAVRKSTLDQKIIFWIPLALIFLSILYLGALAQIAALLIIIFMSYSEWHRIASQKRESRTVLILYIVFFILALAHLILIETILPHAIPLLIYIVFCTVLSDVGGFFFGKFFGQHKLPSRFNANKSWEGILGQLAGSLLGVFLIHYLVLIPGTLWIFLPIGLGSAIGDLANSRMKRLLNITNWAESIPGHGGFIDRFSSLAGSSLVTFYFLLLFSQK